MSSGSDKPKVPDRNALAEHARVAARDSERLLGEMDLDAECRREFEEARERHAASAADNADPEHFARRCAEYLTRMAEIVLKNSQRRGPRTGADKSR
jgi:hypothetical protein